MVFSQDMQVCIGTKSLYRAVGEAGSIFEYDVPATGVQLLNAYPDSILVQWGDARGNFLLGVRETSVHGCMGDWAWLNVAVVGAEIQFSQDRFILCNGEAQILFNEKDFQSYQWKGGAMPQNIAREPGTYELQAFDWNGCLISKQIVVDAPPRVNLGRDTMICTPGFRLYADVSSTTTNPNAESTVYTWSEDANVRTHYLDVFDHPLDRNIKYWVKADLEGCSVSDTVVVLACKDDQTEELLSIPNTFTPNGDGDNDVWQIRALKPYSSALVEVYDRWGRRVFLSAKGYPEPWDGQDTEGNRLPLETYYYIIHLNDGIHAKPLIGTITIVR
jgi:gliding motility-associated-like protein